MSLRNGVGTEFGIVGTVAAVDVFLYIGQLLFNAFLFAYERRIVRAIVGVMKLDEIDEAVVNEAWADDYIRSHIEDFQ